MTTLRLILGDQLTESISSLSDCDKENDIILMCEVWDEATYVKHHKKKIAFLFSAMRHFATHLMTIGYTVKYTRLDDPNNTGSFKNEVKRLIKKYDAQNIIVTEASEYRVLNDMKSWTKDFNIPVDIRTDDRFLATHQDFQNWAKDRKQLRMEFFYREMRRKYNILMNGLWPTTSYRVHTACRTGLQRRKRAPQCC